ncbi:MAG TPA: nitrate- and nitrite sensing domain-containing protein [Ramlibacter sp.]|uniref:nitrate- and nitrite sensing domain-containing protein n=1 Tax=Ramlibacter sp. TaxID=1917967 RepID=UPI002D80E84B|nr:nitrate- and nitrite sensing domain-containing protein [Ramlibacter sp.]HET8749096.1 nitrate- and nitrite sensing domain-containing protein [Ramlibacter sp.]
MKSATSFLLAARQCEIAELEELARTSELVGVIGRFVHALQRERGICNVFLGSHGRRFAAQRLRQVEECSQVEGEVRAQLEALETGSRCVRNGSRLFSRVAMVLHALDGLPALRARVARQALSARDATAAYVKLVTGLLGVVFEAADSATDPKVSRALVALFNFMQGKELAGQERALGAGVFAAGFIDASGQQQWRHLIESQETCFQVFADFADAEVLRAERASREPAVLAEVERLRRLGGSTRRELDPNLSQAWYDWATRRIDAMRAVEDVLARHLRELCEARIAQARSELRDQSAMLAALASDPAAGPGGSFGPHLERSILDLLQEQSRRLQQMGDELDAVRASLNERKVVERAKGLLMAHRQLSEDDAYKALRQMAMNQNRRIVDVAEAVLSLAEVLPGASD